MVYSIDPVACFILLLTTSVAALPGLKTNNPNDLQLVPIAGFARMHQCRPLMVVGGTQPRSLHCIPPLEAAKEHDGVASQMPSSQTP